MSRVRIPSLAPILPHRQRGNLPPLIGIATTEATNQRRFRLRERDVEFFDLRATHRAVPKLILPGSLNHAFRFPRCPRSKLTSKWIVRATKFPAFPAVKTLDHQPVVPSVQFVQPQPERAVVLRTGRGPASPELLDDLMRLLVGPGHGPFPVQLSVTLRTPASTANKVGPFKSLPEEIRPSHCKPDGPAAAETMKRRAEWISSSFFRNG